MRAAAILGLGSSIRNLRPFQDGRTDDWLIGVPDSPEGLDAILLFGGDGTLHRHLPALVRLGLPVLVVPAGSGNDFARALSLRTWRDALGVWQQFTRGEGHVRAVDLGTITPLATADAAPRYFACVGGVGLDADIARRANQLPRWLRKSGGYALSLPPALLSFAAFPMKLWETPARADQTSPESAEIAAETSAPHPPFAGAILRSDRPTTLVALANTPYYGDGMKIAPGAQLDDGAFDVVLIDGIDKLKLLGLFPTVYAGRHLGIKEVHSLRLQRAIIETEHPFDVYADGEFVCKTPAEFRIVSGAMRVIVSSQPFLN